jgi:hypothetical protein
MVLVRDPSVLVLTLGIIQLARDLLALLRDRSARPETRVVIIRGRPGE